MLTSAPVSIDNGIFVFGSHIEGCPEGDEAGPFAFSETQLHGFIEIFAAALCTRPGPSTLAFPSEWCDCGINFLGDGKELRKLF